jgi:hypothetical protein
MDRETPERASGEAFGTDVAGMLRKRLKFVNRRTGMVRRRRTGHSLAKRFPIVSATGIFFSDRRLVFERRSKSLEGFRL